MRNQRPKVSKEYFFRHPGSFPITMKWIATSYLVYGSPEAQSCQQGIWLEADSWWLGLWAWVSCPPGSWELLLPWLSCAPTPLGWNKSVYWDPLIDSTGNMTLLLQLGRKAHVHAPTRDEDWLHWGDSRSTPRSMSALERNPHFTACVDLVCCVDFRAGGQRECCLGEGWIMLHGLGSGLHLFS